MYTQPPTKNAAPKILLTLSETLMKITTQGEVQLGTHQKQTLSINIKFPGQFGILFDS